MKTVFWLSVGFIVYTYLGYPLLLCIWSKLFPQRNNKSYESPEPLVSVIISALNEERHIGRRIRNLLAQDYPLHRMEVIVISDGSNDSTVDIVREFEKNSKEISATVESSYRLQLIELDQTKGKANALNIGFSHASGKYLIFTDCRQEFKNDAIRELIANFHDPKVGSVSGELVFYDDSDTKIKSEIGFYWEFEKWIRKLESSIGSVAGATGAIYAIRKSLFQTLPQETILDDVFIPMQVVLQGYRNVFDSRCIAYDFISRNFSQEQSRKVRTLYGNYQLIWLLPQLLCPIKNSICFRYISHKLLRLFIPFFYCSFVISSIMIGDIFYMLSMSIALLITFLPTFHEAIVQLPCLGPLSTLARTFVFSNYCAILAFLCLFNLKEKKLW
jgi:cellulose synthase/poly-beta-1,6-N-acetylglucosamine synthase-like glycosyltransferase